MRKIVATLDFGSQTIKVIVSEVNYGKVIVLDSKKIESKSLRGGRVIDKTQAVAEVKQLISDVETSLKLSISKIIILTPSIDLKIVKCSSQIAIDNSFGKVTEQDIKEAIQLANDQANIEGSTIVETVVYQYVCDGHVSKTKPYDISTSSLKVNSFAYLLPTNLVEEYKDVVQTAGLKVVAVQLAAKAGAIEAASEYQLEKETVVLEIGHTTTTVSCFKKNLLVASKTFAMGGRQITNDIAAVLGITLQTADILKNKYGSIG